MNAPLATAIGAVIIAIVTGAFGLLNSTKANRPAEMNAQLAWVKQAQDEANEARQEARDAKAESTAARQESEATRQQQVALRRELEAMQEWIDRVVRARDTYLADHALDSIEDSGVLRIMKAINGGPHLEAR